MIPVTVVTGFLGAGKTTLLRRVLRDPAWADSAVIVNEFGEISLDHDLIAVSEERFVSAATGCLCCLARDDLTRTLLDLAAQRAAGAVPPYARVLIETSGLADPAPVLHALMQDAALGATHALAGVVTLVDAAQGAAALSRHPEARRQVMLADRILVTKPDLATPPEAAIRALNPVAPLRAAVQGAAEPGWLLAPAPPPEHLPALLAAMQAEAAARHTPGLGAIALEREAPLPALALTLWLQGLAEHAGPRLLRLKGLVALTECPERPAVLQAVQHLVHPLDWLDSWPGGERRSRLMIIGERIPRHFPARLLAAIEAEVAAEAARR
ncbi:CobW family GTP-binding protein [Roseicella frigidaeris]|uniref:GTP-binding protein n=1 Tax=Roseicella frigidaeris TaxID=2230885 RepID=A0A327M7U1_9PROT|nr:GTP-binding protein [Roseicella frigidaeris]RAI58173.1 GTP-binding protein [Roseicella frigidaeris]